MSRYTPKDFDDKIEQMFESARKDGESFVTITARDLSEEVVGKDDVMAMACSAMWRAKEKHLGGVIEGADSGSSPTFTVRYNTRPKSAEETPPAAHNLAGKDFQERNLSDEQISAGLAFLVGGAVGYMIAQS